MTDIRLVDVHKRYGRRIVLDGVSLDIAKGARVGLIGPAASGESEDAGIAALADQLIRAHATH